jgi:SpoVK/Ycf46/Vps4 family AAA+-type ATPase
MSHREPVRDASAMLRDKYITSSLKDSLKIDPEYPPLEKIGGIGYLLPKIRETIYNPLFSRKTYESIGMAPSNTILLHGASGVGKTFIVNCISQEYKAPIIKTSMENEREVRETFRKSALLDRSIVLIDDIDMYNEDDDRKVIYQLAESLESYRGKALVIATARNLLLLHESLRKFDHTILIRIPTLEDRAEMLQAMSTGLRHGDIDWMEIARATPGFVARDLKRMLRIATTKAVYRGSDALRYSDLELAIKELKSGGDEITFDSIGALEDVKDELNMSIIYPSRFPSKFQKLGINRPSGILLHGPPGCGKTLLARAVSNMSHCNFLSIKGPELISKYVGDSEKEIRKLFDRAKQLQPCVLFFDEIDSLCAKRGSNEFGNRIVNQILTLLDGLSDRGEVYVIGATNRIGSIDKAVMRPGRFDKVVEVPLPSREGCKDIFIKCVKDIPVELFDIDELLLDGLSGADIAGLIREAGILCLRDNFESENLVIGKEHIARALEKARTGKRLDRNK